MNAFHLSMGRHYECLLKNAFHLSVGHLRRKKRHYEYSQQNALRLSVRLNTRFMLKSEIPWSR